MSRLSLSECASRRPESTEASGERIWTPFCRKNHGGPGTAANEVAGAAPLIAAGHPESPSSLCQVNTEAFAQAKALWHPRRARSELMPSRRLPKSSPEPASPITAALRAPVHRIRADEVVPVDSPVDPLPKKWSCWARASRHLRDRDSCHREAGATPYGRSSSSTGSWQERRLFSCSPGTDHAEEPPTEERARPYWLRFSQGLTHEDLSKLQLKPKDGPRRQESSGSALNPCPSPTPTRAPPLPQPQHTDSPTNVNFSPCPVSLFPTELLCVKLLTACSSSSAHPSGPSRSCRWARTTGVGGL